MSKKKQKQKQKAPKAVFHFTAPLYGVGLTVFTSAEAAQEVGFNIDENHGACVCIVERDDGLREVVAIFRADAMAPATLAHEATHAAWRILDLVGIEVNSDNHEALAYLVGWATRTFHKCAARTTATPA